MADKEAKERAAAAGINPDGIDTSPLNLEEAQKAQDEIDKKGYMGIVPDPTPNENYSLETPQDAPTPETDDDLWREARDSAIGTPRRDINLSAAENVRQSKDKKKGGAS